MKRMVFAVLALFGVFALQTVSAQAKVRIQVDLSTQRMTVDSASGSYTWPVSTARSGFSTPRGSYAPQRLERMHYSRKYHMSPMPHSIFFRGGYAIHGTSAVGALGRPASHGCVRLAPGNAATLYQMVKAEGASISITGTAPTATRYASAKPKKKTYVASRTHRRAAPPAYAAGYTYQPPMAYAPTYRVYRAAPGFWQRNPVGF